MHISLETVAEILQSASINELQELQDKIRSMLEWREALMKQKPTAREIATHLKDKARAIVLFRNRCACPLVLAKEIVDTWAFTDAEYMVAQQSVASENYDEDNDN